MRLFHDYCNISTQILLQICGNFELSKTIKNVIATPKIRNTELGIEYLAAIDIPSSCAPELPKYLQDNQ